MAEYLADLQNVSLNNPVQFDASIPCTRGLVYHEDGTGIFILRGVTPNCFARYRVTFVGNIAIPEGAGEVTPIGMAIAVNGEPRMASLGIFTPQAVDEYGCITCSTTVTVPKGSSFSLSVRYVDATTDNPVVEPTQLIEVQNGNLIITRTA